MDTENKVLQIPIEEIVPNRMQPRLAFDDASLQDLAASIKEHGIIQPLILRRVNDKYEIVAGERRYRAARMAGLLSVPALIYQVDDRTSAELAVVENVQRKKLTAIEEAKSYKALLDKGYMTEEDLARKMGISPLALSNKLRLLELDPSVQEAILKEQISERHARSLLKIKNLDQQKQMLNRIITERLTVRKLEEEIKKMNIETEVPLVNTNPNLENIVSNSADVVASNEPKTAQEMGMDVEPLKAPEVMPDAIPQPEMNPMPQVEAQPAQPANMFSNPEQMPNKFFNFLEDEAANMSVEEPKEEFANQFINEFNPIKEEEQIPTSAPSNEEEIEFLDFGEPLTPQPEVKNDTLVDEVIAKIRNLNLNSDRVSIEEINLDGEYKINITIKK